MARVRSAYREAERSARYVAAHEAAIAYYRAREANFRTAGRAEDEVAGDFAAMAEWGWRCLEDRRWPNSPAANVDLVAVGPGGVLVVDVKAWAEPRVVRGRLYRGQAPAEDEVEKLSRLAGRIEELLEDTRLAPQLVVPIIVLAGHAVPPTKVGRVHVVGGPRLARWVAGRPPRLAESTVEEVHGRLDRALVPYDQPPELPVDATVPAPALPRELEVEQIPLVTVAELTETLLAAEAAKPIEEWMTFIHPAQHTLVRRSFKGPARIRGPAGTGKTVTALHRAAYLAATRPGRILFIGFVRTLPRVLGSHYRRISPETADRVEFTGLHAWARELLVSRGIPAGVDDQAVRAGWQEVWRRAAGRLPDTAPEGYWREEIDHVIRARGLTDFEQYLAVDRVGRKLALRREQKAAVWDLYEAYRGELARRHLCDHNDVLATAIDVLETGPAPGYAAVIVDEVHDLNLLGLRLVHRLAGDGPDRLLLLGDGRQAVYPGGARLVEAGIEVSGRRAVVLRDNYRNTGAVLAAAAELTPHVASTDPEDCTEDVGNVVRPGGRPAGHYRGNNLGEHDHALLTALTGTMARGGPAGIAVLCDTLDHVAWYAGLLAEHGIPTVRLEDYDGTPVDAVKLGTYKRAKGLDFAAVFLPRLPAPIDLALFGDPVTTERAERQAREVYVAATRARDEIWYGRLGW